MRLSRIKVAVAGAAAAALVLTGCSAGGGSDSELAGSWDEIVTAAQEEGSVTIYSTHSPDNLEKLKKAFEAEYPGITLTYVRGTDADILPKIEVENSTGSGVADVHMTTDAGWINRSFDTEYSAEVVAPALENPDYNAAESVLEDKFFLTSATVFGLGWNTQQVPEGLSSPDDVLEPRLKGKVGIQNPNGIATYVDMYRKVDVDYGDNFLDRLAGAEPRVYPSAVGITQALASGEVWAAPMAASNILTEQEKGAPVDFALPEKPWGVPWYSHVLASAPNPNAAQLLADFLISPKGQEAISADYLSVLPNIPGTGVEGSTVTAQDVELGDPDTLDPESVEEFQAQWEQTFQR
ncbi:ABC transporter substrate-binding protein [Rhodococcus sp. IEGM 1408]|uniref:ABC transporter substrate-binding protein n=1 Tax=Rhodococcus sp. IEGM 1408 TaxID=3082220 RepID=UPI002952D953|nr:extracellular solute-binding protein [Rhodococcus sp. IEGM 1408]MDV8002641.1 extracellular solute-binding protein [Rhodococcus sp. IEGM 1408]